MLVFMADRKTMCKGKIQQQTLCVMPSLRIKSVPQWGGGGEPSPHSILLIDPNNRYLPQFDYSKTVKCQV